MYKYGAYGEYADTVGQSAEMSETGTVYVGTAPVNLLRGYGDYVNKVIKLESSNAKEIIGYSDDWESFTLCEAISAHFNNPKGNIGPIYVINVLNPEEHVLSETATQKSISFKNGKAQIVSDKIIVDTFAIAQKVEGEDYELSYNMGTNTLTIESTSITGTVTCSYKEVDESKVSSADIIGERDSSGVYTGLHCIELMQPYMNIVPSLIVAPKYSEIPAVYNAMINISQGINSHWNAFVLADIPVASCDTIAEAVAWKNNNAYTSMYSKVYWPQAVDKNGKVFHLSTIAAAEYMRIDNTHDGVPMETNGNKQIAVSGQFFGESSPNQGFDQEQANVLCESGISTLAAYGGMFVLWGDHTAAYEYSGFNDAKYVFDTNMRMLMYIINEFQKRWAPVIDQPMTVALKDSILNTEQANLDALKSMGAIIGTPTIAFLPSANREGDLVNGNFTFDVAETSTPPLKSATARVAYSTVGVAEAFGEEVEA